MSYSKIPVPNVGRLYIAIILLFPVLLLAITVWVNRPPVIYVNRVIDAKTHKDLYQVCVIQHRWGSQTVCGVEGSYQATDFQKYSIEKFLREASMRQRWQAAFQH